MRVEATRVRSVCTVLGALAMLAPGVPAWAAKIELFVARDGSDDADGTTAERALRSLQAAERRIAALPPSADPVEATISLGAGRHAGQAVNWKVVRPGLQVTFRPAAGVADGKVVFDGTKARSRQFFEFDPAETNAPEQAASVRFVFQGFVIEQYCEGISLGDQRGRYTSAGHRVERMILRSIGSKYDRRLRPNAKGEPLPLGDCVAGIRLAATSGTTISRTRFEHIENLPAKQTFFQKYGPGLLHAIYISSSANDNVVTGNVFSGFTGSPVRIRDRSNGNRIERNIFEQPLWPDGKTAERPLYAVSEWYCNTAVAACLEKLKQGERECPPQGTRLQDNRLADGVRAFADESQSKESTCTIDPATARR